MQSRTALDADAKAYAESAATDFIDTVFASWTRTAWVSPNVPREIERIALKWATYEYQSLVLSGRTPEWVDRLRADAESEADRVISAGGPLLADGSRQEQATGTDAVVSRSFEVRNG